ncbi:MAG: MFS transporter [Pseudomonadota bacterium]
MANSIALDETPNPESEDSHGHHGDLALRPGEIAVGVIIGRIGEFFDFFVYGIASALVFPRLFFPFASTYEGLIYSFAIFAVGFVARIPGALLFRFVHDRHGRGTKLSAALMLLGTSTVCIAFLPGYETAGAVSIVLLVVLRFTQGMAVGGAWDGLPSLLAVSAPQGRKGWFAMISQIGAPLGFLVAAGLFSFLSSSIAEQDFISWGWRFAFFTAFAINVVTLFARLRMAVTPEFEHLFEIRELTPSPLPDLFRNKSGDIALGALAPLGSYALFHLVTIFPLTWTVEGDANFTRETIFTLQIVGVFICFATMLVSGLIADKIGRARTMLWSMIITALFCIPAPWMGNTDFGAFAFIPTGFAVLGFSLAQSAGAMNNCFEHQYRYSGALVTNELSWLLGAAFAPLIALVIAHSLGNAGVAYFVVAAAAVSIVVLGLNLKRVEALERE